MSTPLHDQVYARLRRALVTGRFVPGRAVTLRGLAEELGVSSMPVREALRRLSAERALDVSMTRRVQVPTMSRERFDELMTARQLLEGEAAGRALLHVDKARLADMRTADAAIDRALASGDVEGYMDGNHRFHFLLYTASPSHVLVPLIETLWLQFGPFMRSVYGRVGTASLVDQHERAMDAIERGDEAGLRAAIIADIRDGMTLIGSALLDPPTLEPVRSASDLHPPPRRRLQAAG
jgi:DNA-binding GntR family transcriptional regulator